MTDADAALKRETAKWFWRMGCSTLLTVRLSTYETQPKGRIVELTDLDVLGIDVTQDFGVRYRTAECKSGRAGARELFWLRGVSDFFGAHEAYLVFGQDKLRTKAVRELATTLDLGVMVASDFPFLLETYPDPRENLQELLFDEQSIDHVENRLIAIEKNLSKFSDYLRRVYWQMPAHRHLQLGVTYLQHAQEHLDLRKPAHLALLIEHTYRYCLAIFQACQAVLKRGAPAIQEHLPAYIHGGEAGLREATRRIEAAEKVQQQLEGSQRVDLVDVFNPLPPYYPELLELVTRIGRRPRQCTPMLRHLQIARNSALFQDVPPVQALMDSEYDPLAVKLINDVVGFLGKASGWGAQPRKSIESLLNAPEDSDESASREARPGVEGLDLELAEQQRLRVD